MINCLFLNGTIRGRVRPRTIGTSCISDKLTRRIYRSGKERFSVLLHLNLRFALLSLGVGVLGVSWTLHDHKVHLRRFRH
jgi:hypothetical protein